MSTRNTASSSIDQLRSRLNQLRADKLLLTSQLASLRALPDLVPDPHSPLHVHNEQLGQQLRSMEENSILYRTSAWTCFELDLDVGRRARLARDSRSAERDADLALGIRLDTFWSGRFYEPYYLVFARPSQLVHSFPYLTATLAADVQLDCAPHGLRLIRHTVPHFVPLARLVDKYLPSVVGRELSGAEPSRAAHSDAGGLALLSQFSHLPGVHAFLSDLHSHLQAYVSRRQQAFALHNLQLPHQTEQLQTTLEAFGTEAFDLVKITWRIPPSNPESNAQHHNTQPHNTQPHNIQPHNTNPTALALETVAKRKRQNPDDEPTHFLQVVVQYNHLQSDRLVDQTRPTRILHSTSSTSTDSSDEVPAEVHGLRKPYGQVRVQLLEYAPQLETRQRREPRITKADLKALRPKTTRREDLEHMYAQEHDGESMDMHQAFQRVANTVWSQMRRKNSPSQHAMRFSRAVSIPTAVDLAWCTPQYRSLRKLLQPRIDPRLYRIKTPDFRALAAKYPDSFGCFVRDHGGYEAKIDFQDAQAVRCLAQTLLLNDFGIHATLSPSNLCPAIPNRLAYICLIHELLNWTLPTWHVLRHFQTRQNDVEQEVRGLDIGTGASAIYPILGMQCFSCWRFVATDMDKRSVEYAHDHVVSHPENQDRLNNRCRLVHVDPEAPFIPSMDVGEHTVPEFHFTMCNPPFYSSFEEMDESARLKKRAANAVCHGSASEMVVSGGEVGFVQRMVRESVTTGSRVLLWTCMLGKLSSIASLATELKRLSREHKVGGWGVRELPTGGGKTKRWVIMWTTTPLRICAISSKQDLAASMERYRPSSAEVREKLLRLGPGWTRKELFEATTEILGELDGCVVYASAYKQDYKPMRGGAPAEVEGHDATERTKMEDSGTVDVVVTRESWTRKARRAKLGTRPSPCKAEGGASDTRAEPLLMVRICFDEAQTSRSDQETGLVVQVSWTLGKDGVKFESFAMFLLSAIERRCGGDTDAAAAAAAAREAAA